MAGDLRCKRWTVKQLIYFLESAENCKRYFTRLQTKFLMLFAIVVKSIKISIENIKIICQKGGIQKNEQFTQN